MGTGIIVCGLNGAGKSTLGKALAERLDFHFIDIEDLYFPKTNADYPYASPRTREEVEQLLMQEINLQGHFVLASVKGDYGKAFAQTLSCAVMLTVPKDIRIERVRNRSFQKFGDRILPGGNLQEQEENFFRFVESRSESAVEEWIQTLTCPILRLDGTKPIAENVECIAAHLQN